MPNIKRVADYIADFLGENGIKDVFSVTGGGAMHLNDALGKHKKLRCVYNHHEQACAIAAESYARLSGKIAAVCVTTGPGGTNAITGVMGGYVDSIPMLILSGQVRYDTTIHSTDLPVRQIGDQEWDIIGTVKSMTKYAVLVDDPMTIRYHLERALFLAKNGRPGPCWLDIPLNVQSALIDTDKLTGYDSGEDKSELPPVISESDVSAVIEKLRAAKRPCVFVGGGIRLSGGYDKFLTLIDLLGVPVVTAWNSHDLIPNDHPLYAGRPGTVGTRGGNYVVQNSDVLLVLGCRLNIRQISYKWEAFAHSAYKIMVDIDENELCKPTLSIDMKIHGCAADFMGKAIALLAGQKLRQNGEWMAYCKNINEKYPVLLPEYKEDNTAVNPYVFIDSLFKHLREDELVVCSNGSACVCSFQGAYIKKGTRLYTNSGCASMGYGLPAAIGAAIASEKRVICLEGDGSLQMNLQELQTLAYHGYPIKLIVLNNNGYHSIRQTQSAFFGQPLVGTDPESGVGMMPFEKLAEAFALPYYKIAVNDEVDSIIARFLADDSPAFIEVVLNPEQGFSPKLASKMLEDKTMYSPPLEDMFPFLPREEFEENMAISKN